MEELMAKTRMAIMPTTIISFIIASLAIAHIASAAMSEDSYSDVVTDHFMGLSPRSGGRFLAGLNAKKGESCDEEGSQNVCSGIPAKDGEQLLYCCKNHCRNVLSDRNNCGVCGNKCGFGQLCCGGQCTVVAYDVKNCGKCGEACPTGVRCEYGSCGYA